MVKPVGPRAASGVLAAGEALDVSPPLGRGFALAVGSLPRLFYRRRRSPHRSAAPGAPARCLSKHLRTRSLRWLRARCRLEVLDGIRAASFPAPMTGRWFPRHGGRSGAAGAARTGADAPRVADVWLARDDGGVACALRAVWRADVARRSDGVRCGCVHGMRDAVGAGYLPICTGARSSRADEVLGIEMEAGHV